MASIITYDVSSGHTELKAALKKIGYKDEIPGVKCKTIYFPNTTLFHSSKTPSTALEDMQGVSKNLGIELERCVATVWDNLNRAAICGEPFK